MQSRSSDVLIIGGGVAGLCAAKVLKENKVSFQLVEANDFLGGRVSSYKKDGFILDRGFQVLLSSYPEVNKNLNIEKLDLKSFQAGALIAHHGKETPFIDPWRHPDQIFKMLVPKVASYKDYFLIFNLRNSLLSTSDQTLYEDTSEQSTRDFLKSYGFSEKIIVNFFKPFFGGVFLEEHLKTSAANFKYFFRHFSDKGAALPRHGIGAVSDQLASHLDREDYTLNERIVSLEGSIAQSEQGHTYSFKEVIIACEQQAILKLLSDQRNLEDKMTVTYYFKASASPDQGRFLYLFPEQGNIIGTCCFLSDVSPDVAPHGQVLLSVTPKRFIDQPEKKMELIKRELKDQFSQIDFEFLDYNVVRNALPVQQKRLYPQFKLPDHYHLAGDYLGIASLQTALKTGREAGELVVKKLRL